MNFDTHLTKGAGGERLAVSQNSFTRGISPHCETMDRLYTLVRLLEGGMGVCSTKAYDHVP